MHVLNRQFLLIHALVAISYLLLAFSFYFTGFRPLSERLKEDHAISISYSMDAAQWIIQGVLDRHFDLALQTASRSAIRDEQAGYLRGEVSLEALQAFSTEKLADALRANAEMLGIQRHGPLGEVLLQVGELPDFVHVEPCRWPASPDTHFNGVVRLSSGPALVYCSAIEDAELGRIGFDMIFMSARDLQQVLDRPQYHDLHTLSFGLVDEHRDVLLWPSDPEHEDKRQMLMAHLSSNEPIQSGYTLEVRPLRETDWHLLAIIDEQRFFQDINRQLVQSTLVLVIGGALLLLATMLALRRLLRSTLKIDHLTERVQRDGMTGLYNHQHMQQLLAWELARNHRYGTAFSVLMLDLDHFKQINDRHGHPVGDQVLKSVARSLQEVARSSDRVARYGGEEFMLISSETDPRGALHLAERLREEIGRLVHPAGDQHITVTASIGLVSVRQQFKAPAPEELLELADRALYQAKQQGRNRISQTVLG